MLANPMIGQIFGYPEAELKGKPVELLARTVSGAGGPLPDRLQQPVVDSRPALGDNEAFLEKPFSARGMLEAARLVLFGSIATEAAVEK